MELLGPVVALTGSYLVGSIPTAYLVVKRLRHIDVRTVGSGNVGATNVTRAAGLGAGLAVFFLDLAKGLVAVWGMSPWFAQPVTPTVQLACGLAAVLGHVFPVFLRFRGGKGVATTIGVLVGAVPLIAAACLAVWVGCFLIWRYVSVGSLAAAVALPLVQLLTHRPLSERWLGAALALVLIARHRTNLLRLLRGMEHRAGRGDSH